MNLFIYIEVTTHETIKEVVYIYSIEFRVEFRIEFRVEFRSINYMQPTTMYISQYMEY